MSDAKPKLRELAPGAVNPLVIRTTSGASITQQATCVPSHQDSPSHSFFSERDSTSTDSFDHDDEVKSKTTIQLMPGSENKTLTSDDTIEILEKIIPARNKSYNFGLKLKLPPDEVKAIHAKHQLAEDHLRDVVETFLNGVGSEPTWRVIINALRSPAVNLLPLANRLEAAHPFSDTTTSITHNVDSETTFNATNLPSHQPPVNFSERETSTSSTWDVVVPQTTAPASTTDSSDDEVKSKPTNQMSSISSSIEKFKNVEKGFRRRFNAIKIATISCLEKCQVAVTMLAFLLTSIQSVDEHKVFLRENNKAFNECNNHWELFGLLNPYWNYLAYDLLDQLIEELSLENELFESVVKDMAKYKNDLQLFRKDTTLEVFCLALPITWDGDPPADFRKMAVKFDWPRTVTLEDVEIFRKRYARKYNLKKCAMLLNTIRTGSFTVTWFIPVTVIETLTNKRALDIIKEFNVTRLVINGRCIHQTPVFPRQIEEPLAVAGTSSVNISTINREKQTTEDKDYPFIEQPSDDFFCPVTYGLLLQPHLTSCCGKHLSQEATTRIQREGGACPLCMTTDWSTMLSKHFQRQVNALHVFCRHEDRGCGWHGELSDLERHIQSCPMRDAPLMTKLWESALYKGHENDGVAIYQLTVQCHYKKSAPCRMIKGSVTTDNRFAYFLPYNSNSVYSFEWNTEQWHKLPSCPYYDSALVIINGTLTTVGGSYTNKLFTLRMVQWVEEYPPMKTTHHDPAVVTTSGGGYIIVIGGCGDGGGWTDIIEIFQVKTRRWYKLTNIPQCLAFPSATIYGNRLLVIGWYDDVYTCSLYNVDESITSQSMPHLTPWTSLPRLPVMRSTAATLNGQLVIIGGENGQTPVNSIHQLVDGRWAVIGSMSSNRSQCLVVNSSPDKITIVGGHKAEDSVEECVVI